MCLVKSKPNRPRPRSSTNYLKKRRNKIFFMSQNDIKVCTFRFQLLSEYIYSYVPITLTDVHNFSIV